MLVQSLNTKAGFINEGLDSNDFLKLDKLRVNPLQLRVLEMELMGPPFLRSLCIFLVQR